MSCVNSSLRSHNKKERPTSCDSRSLSLLIPHSISCQFDLRKCCFFHSQPTLPSSIPPPFFTSSKASNQKPFSSINFHLHSFCFVKMFSRYNSSNLYWFPHAALAIFFQSSGPVICWDEIYFKNLSNRKKMTHDGYWKKLLVKFIHTLWFNRSCSCNNCLGHGWSWRARRFPYQRKQQIISKIFKLTIVLTYRMIWILFAWFGFAFELTVRIVSHDAMTSLTHRIFYSRFVSSNLQNPPETHQPPRVQRVETLSMKSDRSDLLFLL